MRFVVYGAGAIGGVLGGRLAPHGHDVVLIARGAHHDAIRDRGLRVESPDGSVTLSIPVVDNPAALDLGTDDVVLLCMKSQDTEPALVALRRWHRPSYRWSACRTVWPTNGPLSASSPTCTACV
jgi:2-dehydropantoate 2-reductase